jgi:hypothetical protein
LNRVRFRGRLHGKRLPPGTYRIRAEAIRGDNEKRLGAVTVVIASRSRAIARARAQESTCDSPISEVTDQDVAAANALLRPDTVAEDDGDNEVAAASVEKRPRVAVADDPPPAGDGASVVASIPNPFRDAPGWLQPFMIGMLAVAIILLQLGALPASIIPSSGAAAFVVRRRPALLGTGAGLLGALGVAVLTL